MGKAPLLQQLYRQHSSNSGSRSALENLVSAYLDGSLFDETAVIEACRDPLLQSKEVRQDSPLTALEPSRRVLAILLMLHQNPLLDAVRDELKKQAHLLGQTAFWPGFQLAAIYQILIELLLEGPNGVPSANRSMVKCYTMPSGAVPLEHEGCWPWAEVPHPRFHAELGALWVVYSLLTDDGQCLQAALNLADWQCHTLDHFFSPFVGLFSQEEDVSESCLLINNALLFRAASTGKDNAAYKFLADKQLAHLQDLSLYTSVNVPIHTAVIERWLTKLSEPSDSVLVKETALPPLQDTSLALAGCRLHDSSAVSTLFGGGTGMGCFHAGEVQVVNYGPQLAAILGDCRGFGIEGSQRLLGKYPQKVEVSSDSYVLEGISRIVPYPKEQEPDALYRRGAKSGFWVDSQQTFEPGKLTVAVQFYGVRDVNELAFAFFVKAKSCTAGAGRIVKPRSFDRYRGSVCPIVMQAGSTSLSITPQNSVGEMQVIPLGGEGAFWGADFLIAYLFDSKLSYYQWELVKET